MSEQPFDIPKTWEWATLGEIAEVVGGVTKDSKKQSDPTYVEVPYLRVANVQRGYLDLSNVATIRVSPAKAEKLTLEPGDVLMNEGGDRDKLGRGWVWDGQIPNCIHQNHVYRARILGGVLHPKLLAWHANGFGRDWFLRNGLQSVNLASISLSRVKEFPVPVPPLAEQRRIVAALEEHVSCVDRGSDLVFRSSVRLARLREATLEHLDSELACYESARLADLLREPLRNGHSAPAVQGPGLPTVSITAVTKGEFLREHVKNTSADPDRVRDLWLRRGDILVQRANTPELVGTSAMYDGPDDWAIFPDLLIRVRVNSEVLPEFIALTLKTRRVRHYFRHSAKGLAGSMPKIDQTTVAKTQIRVPPLDRQAAFVQQARESADRVDRLLGACTAATLRARQLRMSIYGEAFAGRLVEQDPGDEPASELLARIRAQRVVVPKQRGRRTAKELAAPATRAIGTDFQQEELPL